MTFAELSLGLERRVHTALQRRAHAKSKLPDHLLLGEQGEDAAYFHLRRLGYTVVARRWRSPYLPGDLDLIAWDGDTLVIFEVKTRTAPSLEQLFVPAEAAVDDQKQKMLRRMAFAYLQQFPRPHRDRLLLRFDILSVYQLPTGTQIDHLRNAFSHRS